MIDVVYPLGKGSKWDNGELRYSLRSLEKHFPDLGRVFICTQYLPEWITNVVCIPVPDRHRGNKDANLIDKVLAACDAGVTKRFLRLSDDQCILQPLQAEQIKKWHGGDLRHRPESYWRSDWKKRLARTCRYLVRQDCPTYFYDTHCPQIYHRDAFVEVMRSSPYKKRPGFTINTLYFNQVNGKRYALAGRKLTVERPEQDPAVIRAALQGRWFLGYNDRGLTDALKTILQELFPNPSRFERH